ncbi:hypothetical protein DXD54_12555 [Clostridium sp. TM06-18]|jgi:hypothetical protein|nr:hypothetical protein [Clostridium sp. TM06-18]RHU35081.1 hypothetical protein DXD54_12555 [Clostridium sp. TM06-18]
MRKRGVVILMAAALTASVPATALADQFAGQIALNGEAASEDVVDEESPVDMDQTEEAEDENHEESENAGLEETDEAEAGTEESEPEESEEEVKESEKSDESSESENEDAASEGLESKEDELEDEDTEETEEKEVVDETELADELQKEPSKAPEEEAGDMPEIGTEEFTAWFKKNCKEDFLWEMLAEHLEDDTFFTWAVEHDKLYYKAFKAYQKILEKDGQPDEEISSEVDAETEEDMAILDEEVEELT